MLGSLLHQKAKPPLFDMRDTPILQLRLEFLMRNFEDVSQLLGMIEPEHVRDGSNHARLEGDGIVLAKRMIKKRKKPEKFSLPHGMPSHV